MRVGKSEQLSLNNIDLFLNNNYQLWSESNLGLKLFKTGQINHTEYVTVIRHDLVPLIFKSNKEYNTQPDVVVRKKPQSWLFCLQFVSNYYLKFTFQIEI